MTLVWSTLSFPAGVDADIVSALLRTLGAQPRGGLLRRNLPVVIETELGYRAAEWRIGARKVVSHRLRRASEHLLPGLTWTPVSEPRPDVTRAAEIRVVGPDRVMATDFAEAAAGEWLRLGHELRRGESVVIQWQIGPWLPRSPIKPVSASRKTKSIWEIDEWGKPIHDSEQVAAARKKASEHVFACVGRIAVAGATGKRAQHLLACAAGSLQLMRAPGVGVSRRAVPSWFAKHRIRAYRVPRFNPPCRLTASELAGLVGWPLGNPHLPGVRYVASRLLPLDERCLRALKPAVGQRVLGEGVYGGQSASVAVLPSKEATRHLHVIGPSGVGKSTLLTHLILADIEAGRSVVAIDPKGDLVTDVLARISPEDRKRVAVLDPSDVAPVGFNPLSGGAVGIDGVLHVLRSIWSDSWGPRLGDVLLSGLLTLASNPGSTLAELPLLLTDASYRRPLVAKAIQDDPFGLGTFWPWFDGLSPDHRAQVLAPVMSRMRALLLRPSLRAVLAQSEPRFDLRSIFTERRTLLVRLPKGQLGSDGSQLIGSMLVSALWRLAQGRSAIPAEKRHPVSLLLDEFQEFLRLPIDLPDALVQARGLGVV